MLAKIFKAITFATGISVIGGYSAINYATYKTLNDGKDGFDKPDVKNVVFSPTFNYHEQLHQQMKTNKWKSLRFDNEISIEGVPVDDLKITYDLHNSGDSIFALKWKQYKNIFV